jgi:hypothetical protein
MMRAARAPAPTSGATVAIAPIALEFELDAVPAEAAEEPPLAPDEAEFPKDDAPEEPAEDVWFPPEELAPVPVLDAPEDPDEPEDPDANVVKIVVIPTVEVNVVLLPVTVVRIAEVVIATEPPPVPLPVAPAEPEPEEAPVLAATPAPEVMSVGFDDRVAFFVLKQ